MMNNQTKKMTIQIGGDVGIGLAIVISWSLNKSILWGIIHGMFSWLYIIYYGLFL